MIPIAVTSKGAAELPCFHFSLVGECYLKPQWIHKPVEMKRDPVIKNCYGNCGFKKL